MVMFKKMTILSLFVIASFAFTHSLQAQVSRGSALSESEQKELLEAGKLKDLAEAATALVKNEAQLEADMRESMIAQKELANTADKSGLGLSEQEIDDVLKLKGDDFINQMILYVKEGRKLEGKLAEVAAKAMNIEKLQNNVRYQKQILLGGLAVITGNYCGSLTYQ